MPRAALEGEQRQRWTRGLLRELGETIVGALGDDDVVVVEIFLNPDGRIWLDSRRAGMRDSGARLLPHEAEAILASVAGMLGSQIDSEHPTLEAELPLDGSRIEGMVPPLVARPCFAIRKRASRVFHLSHYVETGSLSPEQADELRAAVFDRVNIVISGGTGSGKTTLANALLDEMVRLGEPTERFVLLEDTVELQCTAANHTALRTSRHADLATLVRATMRLNPDRIIIGEVRGREALDLLKGWNTGHPGGCMPPSAASDTAIEGATRQFVSTGRAPVLERGDSVIYPFGESQPTLQCTPLRRLRHRARGGRDRARGGARRHRVLADEPALLRRPRGARAARGGQAARARPRDEPDRDHDAAHLSLNLVSPAKGKGSEPESYLRQVRFYYPRDLVESWSSAESAEAMRASRREAMTVASLTGAMNPAGLTFDYELAGGRTLPFRPTVIFDDGHHTYLRLPDAAAASDAPAFLATTDGGEPAILNFRVSGSWIVVDGLLERGELVSGVGRAKRSVRIVNRGLAHLGGRR